MILPNFTTCRAVLVAAWSFKMEADLVVLVPSFQGLVPTLADIAGLLPIRSINASLLHAVDAGLTASPPVVAGVLVVDPFLNGAPLYRALAAKGVTGVVNLPSVAMADGTLQAALDMAGLGADQEMRALAAAREHGLEPIALVFSYADAMRASELGIRHMVLHPGLPSGDERLDRKLAETAVIALERIRRKGLDALLYRHPAMEAGLPGAPNDPGQLIWQVADPTLSRGRSAPSC